MELDEISEEDWIRLEIMIHADDETVKRIWELEQSLKEKLKDNVS